MEVLSYIVNSLRFPGIRDYLRMSAGIRYRKTKMASFWAPHLELSRSFVNANLSSALSSANCGEVVVLGAGSLFDIDCDFINDQSFTVRLIDIDPTVRAHVRGKLIKAEGQGRVKWESFDVTGVMARWTRELDKFVRGRPNAEEFSQFLFNLPIQTPKLETSERCVVSLNLMGQLGIYWRDRVSGILSRNRHLIDSQGEPLPEIHKAIDRTVSTLELEHLKLLSDFNNVILLTDIWYHYYRRELAPWQTESALTISEKNLNNFFLTKGFNSQSRKSWLWHISPQGLGDPDYGEIHEVVALYFKKS